MNWRWLIPFKGFTYWIEDDLDDIWGRRKIYNRHVLTIFGLYHWIGIYSILALLMIAIIRLVT